MDLHTSETAPTRRRRLERVSAACDLCKARKVKCDGRQPCSYCNRRNRADCSFSTPRSRGSGLLQTTRTPSTSSSRAVTLVPSNGQSRSSQVPENRRDTSVPREARLHRDAEGKSIFIGDCAPMSFLQTVRHMIFHHIDAQILDGPRDAVVEWVSVPSVSNDKQMDTQPLRIPHELVQQYSDEYQIATYGLVSLFGHNDLAADIQTWVKSSEGALNAPLSASYLLVLAIGAQESSSIDANVWFDCARQKLLSNMCSSMDVTTVAGFMLVALYLLRASQPNSAYLYFCRSYSEIPIPTACASLAPPTNKQEGKEDDDVRDTAFINARIMSITMEELLTRSQSCPNSLGSEKCICIRPASRRSQSFLSWNDLDRPVRSQRGLVKISPITAPDKRIFRSDTWKSLRVVDIMISCLLGRPPATSDVDCTVPYIIVESDIGATPENLLANVQMFMIIERIVVEVYSRKRISLQIADFVSRQLKTWATAWLRRLLATATLAVSPAFEVVGATQTLCSYYYGIMLLTRPFLIYDLYRHLDASMETSSSDAESKHKKQFADAAVDAAIAFVDHLKKVLAGDKMRRKVPLIVSWLFTTTLVLAIGMLGSSGLALRPHFDASMECLKIFGEVDPAAQQYRSHAQALANSIMKFLDRRQEGLRFDRQLASSQLFGLLRDAQSPPSANDIPRAKTPARPNTSTSNVEISYQHDVLPTGPDWNMYDANFFALPWTDESDAALQEFLQPGRYVPQGQYINQDIDIPLFPVDDHRDTTSFQQGLQP